MTSDLVIPDGIGELSRHLGGRIRQRVTGSDIFLGLNQALIGLGKEDEGCSFSALLRKPRPNPAAICHLFSGSSACGSLYAIIHPSAKGILAYITIGMNVHTKHLKLLRSLPTPEADFRANLVFSLF
jgi:hypothetical protein